MFFLFYMFLSLLFFLCGVIAVNCLGELFSPQVLVSELVFVVCLFAPKFSCVLVYVLIVLFPDFFSESDLGQIFLKSYRWIIDGWVKLIHELLDIEHQMIRHTLPTQHTHQTCLTFTYFNILICIFSLFYSLLSP